jgi:hypothetical protein
MHFRNSRACVIFASALAYVNAGTAYARTNFDRDSNVHFVAREEASVSAFHDAVKTTDGTAVNDGASIATVQGRVGQRGAVRITVRSGNEWANVPAVSPGIAAAAFGRTTARMAPAPALGERSGGDERNLGQASRPSCGRPA